jgi:erythromycin esterase-like protein
VDSLKQTWVRQRAVGFAGSAIKAPLNDDERAALDRIIGSANCIAIGEALHGSKTILQWASRLLKFLIQDSRSGVLILESCFAATQTLDRHVVHGEGEARDALIELGNWNLCSEELLEFVNWLTASSRTSSGRTRPVRVFGCDCQSLDGPKFQLKRLLNGFVARGLLAASTAEETDALLDSLPTDRDLGRFVELVLQQLDAGDSIERRVAEIDAWHNEFIPHVRTSLAGVTARLLDVRTRLPSADPDDDVFLFERCARLLEQVIEFYSPGDVIQKRDAFMAENVLAIQKHLRPERTVLLSHNLHVARRPITIRDYQFVPMGSHLCSSLGDQYRAVGSAVYQGQYLASAGDRPEEDVVENAHIPDPLAFESILRQVTAEWQASSILVDCTANRLREPAVPWPNGIAMRLGEAGRQASPADSFLNQRPDLQFDGIAFVDTTTPITILPGYYRRALEQWKPGGSTTNCSPSIR